MKLSHQKEWLQELAIVVEKEGLNVQKQIDRYLLSLSRDFDYVLFESSYLFNNLFVFQCVMLITHLMKALVNFLINLCHLELTLIY